MGTIDIKDLTIEFGKRTDYFYFSDGLQFALKQVLLYSFIVSAISALLAATYVLKKRECLSVFAINLIANSITRSITKIIILPKEKEYFHVLTSVKYVIAAIISSSLACFIEGLLYQRLLKSRKINGYVMSIIINLILLIFLIILFIVLG